MKRILIGAIAAGLMAILPQPAPADAQTSTADRCIKAAIKTCDEMFPGDGVLTTVARGWCYTIATAGCLLVNTVVE